VYVDVEAIESAAIMKRLAKLTPLEHRIYTHVVEAFVRSAQEPPKTQRHLAKAARKIAKIVGD
jgi:hypothetical protein